MSLRTVEEEYDETLTLPPRLPWVLICHTCMRVTWTVNFEDDWADTVRARQLHEELCQSTGIPPLAVR